MRIEVISDTENLDMEDLSSRLSDTDADYVVIIYVRECKSLQPFKASIGYWWRAVYEVDTEDSGLLILERKARRIRYINTYKAMRNYYWSERLMVGSYMVHELETIEFIKETCRDVKLIVELGGFHGGLTLQLSDNFPDAEVHTFDMCLFDGMRGVLDSACSKKSNITFHKENVLLGKNAAVLNLLEREEKKLLYCDDGRKIAEVRRYAPHLNGGDILGVHDWGVEISEDKVRKTLDNFTPMFHDELAGLGLLTRMWKKK